MLQSRNTHDLFVVILATTALGGTSACGMEFAYSVDNYVRLNQVIVEGAVIGDAEAGPIEWRRSAPGWVFPGRKGVLVVERVWRCEAGVSIAAGDTLRFVYASSVTGTNPRQPELRIRCGNNDFGQLEVGRRGLYSFGEDERFGIVPGAWFVLSAERQDEVVARLARDWAESGAGGTRPSGIPSR